ncbi:MAG: response regulator [Cyanobacteria bacterium P01_D01_bin.156]
MHNLFELVVFLREIVKSPRNGRVHILGEGIEWCIDIINGRLLFATHSFQYLTALDTILPSLGYEAALPIYWRLLQAPQHQPPSRSGGLNTLNWTSTMVGALMQYKALTFAQAEHVLVKLSEDTMESLLGLEMATVQWYPIPTALWHASTRGVDITTLVTHLSGRLNAWESICDRIISPHQRPYCDNPDDLYQPVPQGYLSRDMLKALAQLMQGASIRQLAQAIKQDETKLAQLLYPYVQHRAIKLWPPVQPLDKLPWIANKTKSRATAPPKARRPYGRKFASTTSINGSSIANRALATNKSAHTSSAPKDSNSLNKDSPSSSKSRHLIICIDDSQAMLETIESYLDPTQFELEFITDPVASVSKICAMKPDLVLMDVSMPSINGHSLCEILKRSYIFRDIPIIMISSNASPLSKAKAKSSGATDYLEKPFSKVQLVEVLNTYLKTTVSL